MFHFWGDLSSKPTSVTPALVDAARGHAHAGRPTTRRATQLRPESQRVCVGALAKPSDFVVVAPAS